jgi:hypothetical protein
MSCLSNWTKRSSQVRDNSASFGTSGVTIGVISMTCFASGISLFFTGSVL